MVKISLFAFALVLHVALAGSSVSIATKREIPMWQGIEKTTAQKAADKVFVQQALEMAGGDADAAARRGVQLGWKEIAKGNAKKALRRFNQAWLLNPERGGIYWGFAIATGMRGDDLQLVEKWFKKAESIVRPDWRLHSDWGRVLGQRNQPKAAIPHFLKSIEANPKNPEPHVGMIRASRKLGDTKIADRHLSIYKSLTK